MRRQKKSEKLKPGATIIEPTSGNTGIGLAVVAAVKGYKLLLVMPESMSVERRKLLKNYGAELILTDKEKGMTGAVAKAKELLAANSDYFMPSQFDNPANPRAHEKTTAVEIKNELEQVAALVVGVGTGGTLSGTGRVLKKEYPEMKIFAVEPQDSPVISGGEPGSHMIQGIGAGFIPDVLKCDLIDEVITVTNQEAYRMSRKLSQQEGLMVGISAGANVLAALQVARQLGEDKILLLFYRIPVKGI